MKTSLVYIDVFTSCRNLNYYLHYFLSAALRERKQQCAYSYWIVKI